MENKNIFIIPTENKTNLVKVWSDTKFTLKVGAEVNDSFKEYDNVYITNDENKKVGDYVYDIVNKVVVKIENQTSLVTSHQSGYFKVCLTNDI